ncbi:hypothetical protein C2S51_016247 [Perilla frutescens var. frutescens]|nr:hypothetical protein C2S51_016247 [Perilla frutescens var. frutescens]
MFDYSESYPRGVHFHGLSGPGRYKNRSKSYKRVPPGSLGLPIIGQNIELFKAFRADRGEEWLQERARKYGPISKLNIFGKKTVFLVGQAHNKFIYTCNEQMLSNKQPESFSRLLGSSNILEMSGEDHKRLRGALLTFLKPEALKQYVQKIDQEIRLHFNQHWHHNHQILVMPLMKKLTFSVICTVIFGIERGERRERLVKLGLNARSKARSIVMDLIREKREKLEKNEASNDLITTLLSIRDEAGSPLLSDKEIEDNCAVAMIAGHDTTSALLTFIIKVLAENPHVHQAVFNEQEEIARGKKTSDDPLTWEDLAKMKYSWRVATEALRIYPPILLTFRQVVQDIQMGDYVIPKGWQVCWSGCMTQLDESIYPDPYKFNPWRYENPSAIPPHTMIPFGGGPRMCPGYEFTHYKNFAFYRRNFRRT